MCATTPLKLATTPIGSGVTATTMQMVSGAQNAASTKARPTSRMALSELARVHVRVVVHASQAEAEQGQKLLAEPLQVR